MEGFVYFKWKVNFIFLPKIRGKVMISENFLVTLLD